MQQKCNQQWNGINLIGMILVNKYKFQREFLKFKLNYFFDTMCII